VIVVWECDLAAGQGTAAQQAMRLERFGRALVRRVQGHRGAVS
jgi:G:T-mismatch repair DNA endonuclease (very short patch repair protein)